MFGTIIGALLVAHYLGDYFVQTDVQAQNKGKRGTRLFNYIGRIHCLWHALTYTATLGHNYFPCALVGMWTFDNLPETDAFVKALEPGDDEDED